MPAPIPDHLAFLVLASNEFNGIPDPRDLLRHGGLPGVEYALVLGQNVGHWTTPEEGWQLTKGAPVLTINGPKGTCNSVLLLCKGSPISGAAPDSGPRSWSVDSELVESLGLESEVARERPSAQAARGEPEAPSA